MLDQPEKAMVFLPLDGQNAHCHIQKNFKKAGGIGLFFYPSKAIGGTMIKSFFLIFLHENSCNRNIV